MLPLLPPLPRCSSMTPLAKVLMLPAEARYDAALLAQVLDSGHSRWGRLVTCCAPVLAGDGVVCRQWGRLRGWWCMQGAGMLQPATRTHGDAYCIWLLFWQRSNVLVLLL